MPNFWTQFFAVEYLLFKNGSVFLTLQRQAQTALFKDPARTAL